MDPRVRRFIEIHGDNVRSVREEVAPYIGMSLEERGRRLSALLGDHAMFGGAERRELIAEDPLSPESEALWLRLIREARRKRARD
jgi:hypothetical protein